MKYDEYLTPDQSRRELEELTTLPLRPESCLNKVGTSGRPLGLITNFIPVYPTVDWRLYQHHVTFDTVIDSRRERKNLLLKFKDSAFHGVMIFDGLMLFSPYSVMSGLPERPGVDLDPACRIVESRRENGEPLKISIRLVNTFESSAPSSLQVRIYA